MWGRPPKATKPCGIRRKREALGIYWTQEQENLRNTNRHPLETAQASVRGAQTTRGPAHSVGYIVRSEGRELTSPMTCHSPLRRASQVRTQDCVEIYGSEFQI